MTKQPEALRLADRLDSNLGDTRKPAAAELRRLHAVNEELLVAFVQVMSWIDNWSPELIFDPDWPTDRDAAIAAIAKATGETE